jgi:3-oxoacyl-[acyl-carrier-protein] synthase II
MARVVITGLGAVTPVGNDAGTTWQALVDGQSGVGPLTTFDAATFPVRIGGMVKDFDLARHVPSVRDRRRLSRAGGFGVAATLDAIADAGLGRDDYEPREKGIAMGGSVGRPPIEELADAFHTMATTDGRTLRPQAPADVMVRGQNVPVAIMANVGGCAGPMISINTACAASSNAIGEAFRRIQDGEARLMIAGGYDALTTYLDVLGFALLGAITGDHAEEPALASRPFDRTRSGFVIGEGAIVVVLEELESATRRGARAYAELAGYGSSMNAYRITDSPPDGGGAISAMRNALDDAGIAPDEIDHVVAHGTSTPGNDASETAALKVVFGEHAYRLAISSPKSMTGHLTAAAGALNVLAAARAIRDGVVPPTINLDHPDPKLDLDYVPNVARRMPVRAALANAFAFGGSNVSLVLRRASPDGG